MAWNWQRSDWPKFTWDQHRLQKAEERFLVGKGMFAGIVKHLGLPEREQLTIEAMSTEALTTSEIEGEILDRDAAKGAANAISTPGGVATSYTNRRTTRTQLARSSRCVHSPKYHHSGFTSL